MSRPGMGRTAGHAAAAGARRERRRRPVFKTIVIGGGGAQYGSSVLWNVLERERGVSCRVAG